MVRQARVEGEIFFANATGVERADLETVSAEASLPPLDGTRLPEPKDGHGLFDPYAGRQKMTARFVQGTVRWLSIVSLALTSFGQSLEGIANVDPSLRSHRAASWDRAGGNNDAIRAFAPGETHMMLDTAAPGCIRHIWMTVSCFPGHETYLRDLVIRMYWDGSAVPSVEVPVGDFFGLGHGKTYAFQSVPVAVGENPAAMNCYWPMPFHQRARVELYNNGPRTIRSIYYQVDYELGPQDKRAGLFHAAFRRDPTLRGTPVDDSNLSGKENFVVLETEGTGQYLGCFLYVDSAPGGWWGEGDDMIFIDHSEKPVITGTGSEDYFNNAWGFRKVFSYPFYGCPLLEKRPDGGLFTTVYRWHVPDPVRFREHIRVTLEHLWSPKVTNDLTCVAFWYQTEPGTKRVALPARRANWPRTYPAKEPPAASFELNATQLEETLRERGEKVTVQNADSRLRGWLQIEPSGKLIRIPVPVPEDRDYSIQVKPWDAALEGEVSMGLSGQALRVIQPVPEAPARRPWVDLGTTRAAGGAVVLEVSGRSVGLLAIRVTRQP